MVSVNRISTAAQGSWIQHEYATMDAYCTDGSRFLLAHQHHYELYGSSGVYGHGAHISKLISEEIPGLYLLSADCEPRWIDTEYLVFRKENRVHRMNVNGARHVTLLRKFDQFSSVDGRGESDISEDRNHLVLCGDKQTIFTYDIKADKISKSVLWQQSINALYITPNNNVLVCENRWPDGIPGRVVLLERDTLREIRTVATLSHNDVCRDEYGYEILIRFNAGDPADILLPGCPNGIEIVWLDTGKRECLWAVGYKPQDQGGGPASQAGHVSCPDQARFCVVTLYSPTNSDPSRIYKLPFDGSAPTTLCDTGSVMMKNLPPATGMADNPCPVASVMRDGSRFLFRSNMGDTSRGPNYCDVYTGLLEAKAIEVPVPTPSPVAVSDWARIDYSAYPESIYKLVFRDGLSLTPRPDGGVGVVGVADIFERKIK